MFGLKVMIYCIIILSSETTALVSLTGGRVLPYLHLPLLIGLLMATEVLRLWGPSEGMCVSLQPRDGIRACNHDSRLPRSARWKRRALAREANVESTPTDRVRMSTGPGVRISAFDFKLERKRSQTNERPASPGLNGHT